MNVTKYRCYVDEGFVGERLIIPAIMVPFDKDAAFCARVEEIEVSSRRYRKDWASTPLARRIAFLEELPTLLPWCAIFWKEWRASNNNDPAPKGDTIASAALATGQNPTVRPVIHRLKRAHVDRVKESLKSAEVQRDKIRTELECDGYPGLRLADAVAGYLRHAILLRKPYAVDLWPKVSACLRDLGS